MRTIEIDYGSYLMLELGSDIKDGVVERDMEHSLDVRGSPCDEEQHYPGAHHQQIRP